MQQIPQNEPILEYRTGSEERKELEKSLHKFYETTTEVPIVIGDEEIFTGDIRHQLMVPIIFCQFFPFLEFLFAIEPFNHAKKLAKFSYASKDHIARAVEVAIGARQRWESLPLTERVSIMLKAADLCATKYRMDLNATTMLGQVNVCNSRTN